MGTRTGKRRQACDVRIFPRFGIAGVAAPAVIDTSLHGTARRIEQYEIADSGAGHTFPESLGGDDAARLLQQTIKKEAETDLAEKAVNGDATPATPK